MLFRCDAEREKLVGPAAAGARIATSLEGMDPEVPDIIRQHHESVSGKGYPKGLDYNDVHHLSKIISLLDCYDAMGSPRLFKEGVEPSESTSPSQKDIAIVQAADLPPDLSSDEIVDANPSVAMSGVVQRGMARFDAGFVRAFLENMGIYPLGSYLLMHGGEIAKVVSINSEAVKKPVIEVILDSQGNRPSSATFVDLMQTHFLRIKRPISGLPYQTSSV